MPRLFSMAFLALALTLTFSHGADWPRFRGPNGTGTADGPLPDIDPKQPLWKAKLPGAKGVGSPIIVGGKVYVQSASADAKARMLVCIDAATGKGEWTKELPGDKSKGKSDPHPKNSYASGTPACDGSQLYCAWWDGGAVSLAAYDLKGEEKWQASLGGYKSQHGPGFSPMVHDGLVFVNVDDDERAELVAFDAKTGQKKWIAPRKSHRACYSTPFILERPGKPAELVLGTTTAVTSYDPATGKVNWEHAIAWPKGEMALRVIGHPVYAAGLLIVYSGDGSGARYMLAIDPGQKEPAKVWELKKKDTPYVPCVLVKGDRLFWIGDKGTATCADAKTGKILWAESVFETASVSASPILVGDKMVVISERGEVAVLKADDKFEELSRAPLGEPVFATPAFADGRLYVRTLTTLYCFGKK